MKHNPSKQQFKTRNNHNDRTQHKTISTNRQYRVHRKQRQQNERNKMCVLPGTTRRTRQQSQPKPVYTTQSTHTDCVQQTTTHLRGRVLQLILGRICNVLSRYVMQKYTRASDLHFLHHISHFVIFEFLLYLLNIKAFKYKKMQ